MLLITFVYAHNNRNDALRFKDIVHEILRGNKRYISGDIRLIAMPALNELDLTVINPDEEGNLIVHVGRSKFYHCVSVHFYYPNKEFDDPSKPFIEMNYISNGHKIRIGTNCCLHDATLSKADHSVMTKINQAYDEFEFTELDENMPEGPQTTGRLYLPSKEDDEKPRMIDWLKEFENRIPENDPLYEQFHEFKNKALAYRKEKIEDIFTGRKEFLKPTTDDYGWLKNLLDPADSDGDVPNIRGLKELFEDIMVYACSWSQSGIKDISDRMVKIATCASSCKSILEGKNPPVSDLVMKVRCPHCKEEIVASPIVEEKKLIKKDDRLQAFTLPCDTCNCRKESIHRRALMNDLQIKLDAASEDLFKLGVNKERLTLGEIKTAESKIRNEVYACRSAIHQIIQQTAIESWSKEKEEDTVLTQIDELKAKLRTLPDPRYLPNANYTRKLIDELDDLLNGSNVIKAKDNTYILNADTLYNAVAKLSAIRNAVSKPGMWVDSQTSAWIHLNKDFETLKTLKSYLETEANKDTDDDPLCIITSSTINHMIELIDDALNLYAVDPE